MANSRAVLIFNDDFKSILRTLRVMRVDYCPIGPFTNAYAEIKQAGEAIRLQKRLAQQEEKLWRSSRLFLKEGKVKCIGQK